MKFKKNLLSTLFSEIHVLRWLIVLYMVIISVMFTVLLSMISFAEHIPHKMALQLNDELDGSIFKAEILSLTSKNAEVLAEIPAAEVQISFLAEAYVLNGALISSNTAVLEGEGMINICTTSRDNISHISKGRGVEYFDNTSGEYSLWLSESSAAILNVKIGDALQYSIEEHVTYPTILKGIYHDTYNEAAFMINASLAETVLKDAGKTTRQSCYAEFFSYYDCRNAVSELENNGCEVKCLLYDRVDEIYDDIRYMQMIFIIILLVLFICLGIILYAMNSMLIDVRAGFIAMLKALGEKNSQIVKLYLAICEPVLTFGILAGCLMSKYYINYTAELMETYLELSVSAASMAPTIITALIAFLGANTVLAAVFAVMYGRISKVSAAALFNSAERDG